MKVVKKAALTAAVLAVPVVVLYAVMGGFRGAELWMLRPDLNVLVVTIDTCRADHLGCYGYEKARTPVIDSLAASGVLFEKAFALQPATLPSHSTIFTGTHPAHHKVLDNGLFALPGEAETMAEVFQDEGVTTGAIISAFVLHRQYGLDQGFDFYDDRLTENKAHTAMYDEMKASVVSDRAINFIEQNGDGRFFLWLHYFDPHAGYLPPAEFEGRFEHPYDGEIAYVDRELGRVIGALEKRGLRAKTLIVVTADHGESLDEHGEHTHGMFLYNATQHVPLIMSLEGTLPRNRRIEENVSLMDIMPTVLDIAGIPVPEDVQGLSLADLIFSDGADHKRRPAPVIMETHSPWYQHGFSPSYAVIRDGYKYIKSPKPELYDLVSDPDELRNIIGDRPSLASDLSNTLEKTRARYAASPLKSPAEIYMTEKSRRRLESLGYLPADRSREDEMSAPDAKDKIGIQDMLNRAERLKAEGKIEKAVEILEKVVEQNPGDVNSMTKLALLYSTGGKVEEAITLYREALEISPYYVPAYVNLGNLYVRTNEYDKAIEMANSFPGRREKNPYIYNLIGYAYVKKGDYKSAVAPLERALELYPTFLEAHVNLGTAYGNLGDYRRAFEHYSAAHRMKPDNRLYESMMEKARKYMEK